ncbi:hypothetical protein HMPREF0208_03237 [Citrobacter koseri]|nr:hypothetical protein HMPREF3207_01658 [Citrobacter koseri]KXA03960.1 hypothetical protein HMPREF3220_00355 [Citrobacter koseri]KXB42072.1 hypothetical protein HMPREF0208_03237 [Citrobacter koseri]
MGRFVPGAAAGNHRDVVTVQIAANHDTNRRIALQAYQIVPRAGDNRSFNDVIDEMGSLVKKELSHNGSWRVGKTDPRLHIMVAEALIIGTLRGRSAMRRFWLSS